MEFDALAFRDIRELTIVGQGWSDPEQPFDRLPGRAKGVVTEKVWNNSVQPVGVAAVFETNATHLGLKWTTGAPPAPNSRMSLLGFGGFDLYGQDEAGTWAWVDAVDPGGNSGGTEQYGFVTKDVDPGPREGGFRKFRLYFPTGTRVLQAEIGVNPGAEIRPAAEWSGGMIAYYGTSIVHGRHNARPGTNHAAILQRRVQQPMLNLGFAGSAHMEEPLAHLLAELDPQVWLIDPVPNMGAEMIRERARKFLEVIREKHPETPILLIEDREHANARFFRAKREDHAARRRAWREVFAAMVAEGDKNVRYLGFDDLLGLDGEATNDGSHPTDLGFFRYANAIEPALRTLLRGEEAAR